jgi:hypothetical protein
VNEDREASLGCAMPSERKETMLSTSGQIPTHFAAAVMILLNNAPLECHEKRKNTLM